MYRLSPALFLENGPTAIARRTRPALSASFAYRLLAAATEAAPQKIAA